jgi:hypothetical protein
MSKRVQVTKAQAKAVQMIVERSATTGRYVRAGVSKIADASAGRTISNPKSTTKSSLSSSAKK